MTQVADRKAWVESASMVGVRSISTEFGNFIKWLCTNRPIAMAEVAQLANGFETWLKIEFLLWLRTTRRPALGQGDAGVEYKFSLATRDARKQCDVWVRSGPRKLYHYVEIKVPFANANQGKMLDSAAADFILMTQMRTVYEQAASANVIILGVRFTDLSWERALNRIRRSAGIAGDACTEAGSPVGSMESLRWHVFTRSFE